MHLHANATTPYKHTVHTVIPQVCLSLLGTWSGGQGESWSPEVSTMFQVGRSLTLARVQCSNDYAPACAYPFFHDSPAAAAAAVTPVSLPQVLISIQSLILVDEPYFNGEGVAKAMCLVTYALSRVSAI